MKKKEEQLEKIKVVLPEADWHQYSAETLWANSLGEGKYVLENSPFFADNLSYKDTVYAEHGPDEGFPIFKKAVERSQHSTYRIFLLECRPLEEFEKYFDALNKIGCTYEGLHKTHFSIDVPPETDIMEVFNLLQKGEDDGIWYFESAHIGHDVSNAE